MMIALLSMLVASATLAAEPPTLHARIDTALDASRETNAGEIVDDATFARRVHLDLAGVIPTAEALRGFLDDESPNKRAALVDKLLDSPRFAQHMADVFDVMLMERRADKHVKHAAWRGYLVESFRADKPLDKLVREVLAADGTAEKHRTAARFYLDREGDKDVLTRDIGRLFLGRDLQCAQCHDHPDIDGYVQSDYYGLRAFLERSFIFTDKKKRVFFAEKAEGETTFRSVFKPKDGPYPAAPKLIGQPPVDEPAVEGATYLVKPAKDVRPVPKYSRREELAKRLTDGQNRLFARNMANRLWALMMGRGLVDPVDHHHGGNPPTHPRVLEVLTDALIQSGFQVKPILRGLALTHVYQRSIAPPAEVALTPEQAEQRAARLSNELEPLRDTVKADRDRLAELEEAVDASAKAFAAASKALAEVTKKRDAAKKPAQEADKALEKPRADFQAQQKAVKVLAAAAASSAAAAKAVPDDKALADAARTIAEKAAQAEKDLASVKAKVEAFQTKAEQAADKLAAAQKAVADAAKQRDKARTASLQAQEERLKGIAAHGAHVAAVAHKRRAIELHRQLAGAQDGNALADALSLRFAVRELKPLSPEQLAMSMMRATGELARQRAAAQAEVAKREQDAAEKAKKDGKPAPSPSDADHAAAVEQVLCEKVVGHVNAFVDRFAAAPGQPQDDFFATVDQTLFLNNHGLVRGWLNPSGENLVARLSAIEDPAALAEELYLCVLSRRPTDEEVKEVNRYVKQLGENRTQAMQEMAWALLGSVEFRFNH